MDRTARGTGDRELRHAARGRSTSQPHRQVDREMHRPRGDFRDPHEFRVRGQVCDTLGRQALNIPNQPSACHEILVVNHYITKSKQDWLEKLRRGSPDRDDSNPTYDARVFDDLARDCEVRDGGIMRFGPKIRALLATNEAPVTKPGATRPDK